MPVQDIGENYILLYVIFQLFPSFFKLYIPHFSRPTIYFLFYIYVLFEILAQVTRPDIII